MATETTTLDLRLFLVSASKTELVDYLVDDHNDPRGGWDRFYRTWSKDALRTQILKRAERRERTAS